MRVHLIPQNAYVNEDKIPVILEKKITLLETEFDNHMASIDVNDDTKQYIRKMFQFYKRHTLAQLKHSIKKHNQRMVKVSKQTLLSL